MPPRMIMNAAKRTRKKCRNTNINLKSSFYLLHNFANNRLAFLVNFFKTSPNFELFSTIF